mgnify:CR=1 FL=1
MVIPPIPQELINEDTMLSRTSIEDLKEYKKNACEILRNQMEYTIAKIVEELIDQEIETRKIIEKFNSLYEQFPEYGA